MKKWIKTHFPIPLSEIWKYILIWNKIMKVYGMTNPFYDFEAYSIFDWDSTCSLPFKLTSLYVSIHKVTNINSNTCNITKVSYSSSSQIHWHCWGSIRFHELLTDRKLNITWDGWNYKNHQTYLEMHQFRYWVEVSLKMNRQTV